MADKFLTNHFIQRILSTLPDRFQKSVSLLDRFDVQKGTVVLRGIEAGPGIDIAVLDADNGRNNTTQTKIVISVDRDEVGVPKLKLKAFTPELDQTVFALPEAEHVIDVLVNGISTNPHWEHVAPTVTLHTDVLGYRLDGNDEVIIQYYEPPVVD